MNPPRPNHAAPALHAMVHSLVRSAAGRAEMLLALAEALEEASLSYRLVGNDLAALEARSLATWIRSLVPTGDA
jgi:hypothetical protein